MNFYLESAKAAEYQELMQFADFKGVISTPSMFTHEGLDVKAVIDDLLEVLPDNVMLFIPVIQSGFRSILKEAREIASLAPNVIPTIPFSPEGLMALKACSTLKVKAACSKISKPEQLVFALNNKAPILLISKRLMNKAKTETMMLETLKNNEDSSAEVIFYDVTDASDAGDLFAKGLKNVSLKPAAVKEILQEANLISEIQEEKDEWIMTYTRMELFE